MAEENEYSRISGTGKLPEEVKPEYVLPPDVTVDYANSFHIVHNRDEFLLSFLQVQPPLVLTEDELMNMATIKSECVGRFFIHPNKMPEFINLLINNWNRYQVKYLLQENADGATNSTADTATDARDDTSNRDDSEQG